jgi:hypothetical protein
MSSTYTEEEEEMSLTTMQEEDIPSFADTATGTPIWGPSMSWVSFALPDSMAFFKRLTFEITSTGGDVCRYSQQTAEAIAAHIGPILARTRGIYITSEAICNAHCLGVAFPGQPDADEKEQYPHLYVVFPYRKTALTEELRQIWDRFEHEQDDEAPGDKVIRHGMFGKDTMINCEEDQPTYVRSVDGKRILHMKWPEFYDRWGDATEGGTEGEYSDDRAVLFDEAWTAIQESLETNAVFKNERCEDPILLAVWHVVAAEKRRRKAVQVVAEKWDAYADSRYAVLGSFRVECRPRYKAHVVEI